MALDGIFLRHIKSEIEKEALGARVWQGFSPEQRGGVRRRTAQTPPHREPLFTISLLICLKKPKRGSNSVNYL